MKIEITENSRIIETILTSLKKEKINKHVFDGEIKDGKIDGYCSSFGFKFLGPLPSMLKVKGEYDLKAGKLILTTSPSNVLFSTLFFAVFIFVVSGLFLLTGRLDLIEFLLPCTLSLFSLMGFYAGLIFSNKSFKKYISTLHQSAIKVEEKFNT